MRPRTVMRFLVLGVVALAMAILASADAQTLLRTLDTPNPQEWARFGSSLAVGDVNGDGRADIAVGVPYEDVGGNDNQGRAYVFSGATSSLLFTLDTPSFGYSLAVGDVNGDGKGDIAVGTPEEDVGANNYQGRAYVFSGADGSLLLTLDTPNPQELAWFGYSVAVGDVNGDGKGEIAVGAYREDVGGNNEQGRAYVFSGADGSLLLTLDTPNPEVNAFFGYSLAGGDVNGDGKGDIAIGAIWQDVGGYSAGRAYVFSGANGSLLFTLDTPNPQDMAVFANSLAVRDVDGDGKADVAVGAVSEDVGGIAFQGRAYAFSGASGSLLFTLDTPNPQVQGYFGSSLAVGDVDGDGKADVAVGADGEEVGGNDYQGRAYVFSGGPVEPTPTPTDTPRPTNTPTPTSTSMPTPTRPPGVGGTVKLPPAAIAAESGARTDGSGWSAATLVALAGGMATALIALGAGGRYARRRWLR